MRIILIKPCWNYPIDRGDSTYNRTWPPLSLLNCAAILRRNGFDVEVLDASARRLSPEETAEQARHFDLAFITSASLDRWQCPNIVLDPFLKTVFELKRTIPRLFVMGTHGTVRPHEILDITGVDGVIVGEPEAVVLEISRNARPDEIGGLAFYDQSGQFRVNPSGIPLDLTQLPIPAYDLIDIADYRYEVMGSRFALLEASRGCPFQCMFCVKSMYGSEFRVKTVEQMVREIDFLIDRVRAEHLYFIDLEFTVNRDMVEAICSHLINRNTPVSWCCQTRADSVNLELLGLMKSAGCRIVHYGVETGSERMRQTLNKGITREQIEKGMKDARTAGLQTVCFFMFGLPGETVEDMKQTVSFAQKLNPTYASFHIALPYPGTSFHDQVSSELKGELFPKAYTGVVPYAVLERMTRKAFRSYYLRPRYIAGRLKDGDFSTFFHQAKFFLSYLKHRLGS